MRRLLVIALRSAFVLLGLILIAGGVAGFLAADVMHSEAPPVSSIVLLTVDLGSIGYGLLLVVPLRWLLRFRWLSAVLILGTAAFAVGVFLMGLHARSAVGAALAVAVRMIPAAVVFALAAWEHRGHVDGPSWASNRGPLP